jgi:nitrite reductase (NO-forming)
MIQAIHDRTLARAVLSAIVSSGIACTPIANTGTEDKSPTANATRAKAQEINLTSTEFKFAPRHMTVVAGQPVTLVLDNSGATVEHDITADELGVYLRAKAGEVVKGSYTFDKPGTYAFKCSLPGHKETGMDGILTVASGDAASPEPGAVLPAASSSHSGEARARSEAIPATGLATLPTVEAAPPVNRKKPALVQVELETKSVTAQMADGVGYTYWTFNGSVPGPMIRVRQGDTVELTLKNSLDSPLTHSIDSHGVTGPGGGGKATQTPPGGRSKFRFKALKPGAYVYHCATPMIPQHLAHGLYGLMVVEPPEGWRKVDHEYYVMQGDFYLTGDPAQPGMHELDVAKLSAEHPDYVLFNGSVGALSKAHALNARVGETVRIFFGVGGPNVASSFHAIGEIFDRVYPEGASDFVQNVQTTFVPAGGSAIVEFKLDTPGSYILVDHSLSRLAKGAAAFLDVEGPNNSEVFEVLEPGTSGNSGH